MGSKRAASLLREIAYYIRREHMYLWVPLVIVLFLVGLILLASQTMPLVSPFIYTLF